MTEFDLSDGLGRLPGSTSTERAYVMTKHLTSAFAFTLTLFGLSCVMLIVGFVCKSAL
jgi:hypothetical protein